MSYIAVWDKYTDGEWRGPAHQHEAIMHAWESGAPRVTFVTRDGAEVTLATEAICAVSYVSDEAEQSIVARYQAERLTDD